MNEEPTFSLEELGEIKTVKVYNQAYVDKQQKRIEELEDKLNNLASVAEVRLANWQKYEKENAELKEIIREFVNWANWQGNSKCPSFKSIRDKAEQFLEGKL